MRINQKNIRRKLAVSEILSTVIMLGIATTSFSGVSYYVLSYPAPTPTPIVEMSGMIDDNQVIVIHRGGEPLDLDTELVLNIGGSLKSYKVGDFLDSEAKEDGVWGLSEKFVYPLNYDFDYLEYPDIKINVVDSVSNSLLMNGLTKVNPICDIGIEVNIDNKFPGMETNIVFTVTVTNNGNINESGVIVSFNKPPELFYYSHKTTKGVYNYINGIWEVGLLIPGQSENLIVECIVGDRGSSEDTQLLMILDGSGSINYQDWSLQLEGLAAAIENEETFPHDSSVELTIIQFGGGSWWRAGRARLEIGPVVVNEDNYFSIVNSIRRINQLRGMTPTACGIYLGADKVVKSGFFDSNIRQVVMMVTDGNPTQSCDCDGDYKADGRARFYRRSRIFRTSSEAARDYLINTLKLTIDQDEFDVITVGDSDRHASWLKEKIVWPQPSYYAAPFLISGARRGWIRNVTTWDEFAQTIDEAFGIIFNQLNTRVRILETSASDPKITNDISDIVVIPTSSPKVITKPATNIEESSVTFNMYYNFKWINSGEVRFMYHISESTWQYTPWEFKTGADYYSKIITGLTPGYNYTYRAQLKYEDDNDDEKVVNVKAETFVTPLSIAMD